MIAFVLKVLVLYITFERIKLTYHIITYSKKLLFPLTLTLSQRMHLTISAKFNYSHCHVQFALGY